MIKIVKRILSSFLTLSIASSMLASPAVFADDLSVWEVSYVAASGSVTSDSDIYYSGGNSVKIVNNTPRSSNKYIMLKTQVQTVKGKKYKIKGYFKTDGCDMVHVNIDWNDRMSLCPFTQRFDWTGLEYDYIGRTTGMSNIQLIVEGVTGGYWVDNFQFIDTETGENLISEGNSVPSGPRADDNSAFEAIYESINASSTFSASSIEQVMGGFKYIPAYKAEGITVDGNIDEWEKYPAIYMPTLSSQYQVYINDSKDKDVKAICKFAYDDENLYLMVDVTDNDFVSFSGSSYWQGDSIQLAISSVDEGYGTEIGFAHNAETGLGEVHAPVDRESEQKGFPFVSTYHEGTRTVYEASIPWTYKFGKIPEQMYFDILANDNDGSGRRYCAELAPGISEGKTNAKFPKIEFLDDSKDWYAWVQGERSPYTETDYTYEYFIVNNGASKKFTVKNVLTGETEEVTVGADSGVRREFNCEFEEAGDSFVTLEISDGTNTHFAKEAVSIGKKLPTEAETREVIKVMRQQDAELSELIAKCEAKGIPVHYEMIVKSIIGRFDEYLEDDIANNDYTRVDYTSRVVTEMYNEAKADLEAYLKGEKTSLDVPVYVTSDLEIDGQTIWADTELGGEITRRPVFFIGYGHGSEAKQYVPEFPDWGVNSIQCEAGPDHIMTLGRVPYWGETSHPNGTMEYCTDTVYDGKKSLKFTFKTQPAANVYLGLGQNISCQPGKTYELKGYIKAKNATRVRVEFSEEGWTASNMVNGTYDWKEFTVRYTPTSSLAARILVDGVTDEFYIDGLTVTEVGKSENLLLNGSFEEEPNKVEAYFNRNAPLFVSVMNTLQKAEENNVSVSVLISPHYFKQAIADKYNIGYRDIAFFKHNVHAPEGKRILDHYAREFVSEIKKYKSVNSICITNEPQFRTNYLPDYFKEGFNMWLSERYNGDINELNKAYGTEYADFLDVPMDVDFNKPEELNPAKWYDYKKYNDEMFGEFHEWLAGIVKEVAPEIPVTSKVQAYTAINYSANNNELGTSYENFYKYLDLNGCDAHLFMSNNGDHNLSKGMWYDYMTSYKNVPVANTEDHIVANRDIDFSKEQHLFMARDIWQGVIHGVGINDIWNWARTYNKLSDSWLSILFRPDAIKYISEANLDMNRLSYEIRAIQQESRDVGIIYSDVSNLVDERTARSTYEAYEAVQYNGKRVKFITQTLLENMMDCKVVIVPLMPYATEETLVTLKRYIENGGRVVIMSDESLAKTERNADMNAELREFVYSNATVIPYEGTFNKMKSPSRSEFQELLRNIFKEEGIYNVSVIDTETGKPTTDVEFNTGVYNGDVVINLVNYGTDKKVKIMIGGTEVTECIEMRSMENVKDAVELKQFVPVLVKFPGAENLLK